ncbi:MAG: Uma2 family endonuclease [Pseudorhodobacter sp.]|nr:Uma2 family endonuclease [Frankiaceae bacterium]
MEDGMGVLSLDECGPWLFEELGSLPDDGRKYEVVDGNLVVTPPPSHTHQAISNGIAQQLQKLSPDDWLVMVELALPLGTDGRVPDVAVVRAGAPLFDRTRRYPVGPEWFGLVVEVVSDRSRKTDRFAKPGEYAEAGIGCFWRVEQDPTLRVHGYRLVDGTYVEQSALPVPWGEVGLDLSRLQA